MRAYDSARGAVRSQALVLRRPGRTVNRRGLISEEAFERRVIALARLLGWKGYHTRKSFGVVMGVSMRDAYGFPDWIFVHRRRRRVLFRELKTDRGVVTAWQREWLDDLVACGQDAKVWRPSDWPEIEETFAA